MRPRLLLWAALLAGPASAQPRLAPARAPGALPALPAAPARLSWGAPLPGLPAELPPLGEVRAAPDLRAVAAAGIEIQGRAPKDYQDGLLWGREADALAALKAAGVRRRVAELAGAPGASQRGLGQLFDAAGREGALRFEREPGEAGGDVGAYGFQGAAVLSRSLLSLPELDLVPLAAHELHHLHEHERGLVMRAGYAMEVRAHRVQNAARRAGRAHGWWDGFVGLTLRSPSLLVDVPLLFPPRLAPYARAYWTRGLDVEHPLLVQALRYYRSLSTIEAAEESGRLNELLERLYPDR